MAMLHMPAAVTASGYLCSGRWFERAESRVACCDSAEPAAPVSPGPVQATAPVLKMGQQTSVRHAFSSAVSWRPTW
jgi:hypothetical protein